MTLIINSFDFWFKIWNTILLNICFGWIYSVTLQTNTVVNVSNSAIPILHSIARAISTTASLITMFLLDAWPFKRKIVNSVRIACIILILFIVTVEYFIMNNLYYNIDLFKSYNGTFELDSESRVVNIKNIYLGSWMNIVLFVAKPILVEIAIRIKKKVCFYNSYNHNNVIRQDSTDGERLTAVHKCPKLKSHKQYEKEAMQIDVQ